MSHATLKRRADRRRIRREALEEAARTAELFIHSSVSDEASDADDVLTRQGRYSNGTVRRIAAAIRALHKAVR